MQNRLQNLDGLRFFAALVVLIGHVESMKTSLGMPAWTERFFLFAGQYAVTFFFVLSGFLITWLLLQEKRSRKDDRISIRHFYIKRIFRIWPLYYLLLFFAYFIGPHLFMLPEPAGEKAFHLPQFLSYLAFLPNTAELFFQRKMMMGQVWSLGVEEFFYLFYPLLLYAVSNRRLPYVLLSLSLLFIIASMLVVIPVESGFLKNLFYYLMRYRLFSFLIGGLAAWYLLTPAQHPAWAGLAKRKIWSHLAMIILFICTILALTFSLPSHALYSIAFGALFILLYQSGVKYPFLNHPWVVYLGKISYGIYMLHPVAILLVLQWMEPYITGSMVSRVGIQLASLGLTLVLSVLTYELFEKYFLRKGKKLATAPALR